MDGDLVAVGARTGAAQVVQVVMGTVIIMTALVGVVPGGLRLIISLAPALLLGKFNVLTIT